MPASAKNAAATVEAQNTTATVEAQQAAAVATAEAEEAIADAAAIARAAEEAEAQAAAEAEATAEAAVTATAVAVSAQVAARATVGSSVGSSFSTAVPPGARIVAINSWNGALIDGIGIEYETSGGRRAELPIAGAEGGSKESLELKPDEKIVRIVIFHDVFINSVTFETNTRRSVTFGESGPTGASPNPRFHQIDIGDGFELVGLQGFTKVFRPNLPGSFAVSALGCLVE